MKLRKLISLLAITSIAFLGIDEAHAWDTDGPNVGPVVVMPEVVDVTISPVTVKVQIAVSDSSGVDQGQLPSVVFLALGDVSTRIDTQVKLISGDSKNGTYQAVATINTSAKPGRWEVQIFGFKDFGGYRSTNGAHIGGFNVQSSNKYDTDGPRVSTVFISPSTVDISKNEAVVTASISVTDETGVDFNQLPDVIFLNSSDVSTRIDKKISFSSGDEKEGIYSVTATIPVTTKPGQWEVQIFAFKDKNGFRSTNGVHLGRFVVSSSPVPTAASSPKSSLEKDKVNPLFLPEGWHVYSQQRAEMAANVERYKQLGAINSYKKLKAILDLIPVTPTPKSLSEAQAYETLFLKYSTQFVVELTRLIKESTTITCLKGKVSKRISDVKPVCPLGYKLKSRG
jgi:hypothetical protein